VKKSLILAGALIGLLPLGGCVGLNPNVATPQQVIVASNAFDAAEATATNYLRLPPCPTQKVCRDASVVAKLVPAVRTARGARDSLIGYVKSNPGQNAPVTLIDALTTSVTTLTSLETQYSVAAATAK